MLRMDTRKPGGMVFHEWQDVIHETPDGQTINNFAKDDLSIVDISYLSIELMTRNAAGGELPQVIKKARGIGNWKFPKVCLIARNIPTNCGRNNPKWEGFKVYRRMRPYSTSLDGRDQLFKLVKIADLRPEDVYVTSAEKTWLPETSDIALFQAELETVHAELIICDGPEAYQYTRQYGTIKCQILPRMVAQCKGHTHVVAAERRDLFRKMVRG